MSLSPPQFLDGPNGRIAYRQRNGAKNAGKPGVVWLGGFRSDMIGTKATFVDEWAKHHEAAFLRFDYSGHGESDGVFEDGCIGDWFADALAAFDALTTGPQILIGSSMGAWIATLLAKARPNRIASIIYIAPAPDFTERLMWPAFTDEQRETMLRDGRIEQPSDYSDEPEVLTLKLIEDGRNHLVMTQTVPITCPVRILQGVKDDAVPWRHAVDFADMIETDDVEISLKKAGDHRLSEPDDLARLREALDALYSG